MRKRPRFAAAVLTVAVTAGCSLGNTEGGGTSPDFYWTVVNNSDQAVVVVMQQADRMTGVVPTGDPERPDGRFSYTVAAGESVQFQEGQLIVGDTTPGGCFVHGDRWLVRSRSGKVDFPRQSPVDEYLDDLEVVAFLDGSTCTDQQNFTWQYDGVGLTNG